MTQAHNALNSLRMGKYIKRTRIDVAVPDLISMGRITGHQKQSTDQGRKTLKGAKLARPRASASLIQAALA